MQANESWGCCRLLGILLRLGIVCIYVEKRKKEKLRLFLLLSIMSCFIVIPCIQNQHAVITFMLCCYQRENTAVVLIAAPNII